MSFTRKILAFATIAAMAFSGSGCTPAGNAAATPQSAADYAEKAEHDFNSGSANYSYNKAQYLSLMEAVENNSILLERKNQAVDISRFLDDAKSDALKGEAEIRSGAASFDYNQAQYQLLQAILKQQEALCGTECSSIAGEYQQAGKTAAEYAKKAEEQIISGAANFAYDQAEYLSLRDIVDNNIILLERRDRAADISQYLDKARTEAQNGENDIRSAAASFAYNQAQYQLLQAILLQQDKLLN